MTAVNGPDCIVSLRESRIVVDRLLQWKGFPAGRRPALTEAGLYSASLGLSGFERLLDSIDVLKIGIERHSTISGDETDLCLDAHGKHAWAVAEEVSDLLTEMDRYHGKGCVKVVNLVAAEELAVVGPIIQKHDLDAHIEISRSGTAVARVVEPNAPRENELLRICHHGIPTDHELWFALFHASNAAQAPDTKLSRLHTGPITLAEDGTLVGAENGVEDHDMDASLLTEEFIVEPVMKKGKDEC